MEKSIDEAIKRFQSNAEYERTHGNLQGCLEFRQIAEWLEQLQKIDKSAMMHEIYMAGVNMAGEYQGCWVRFKEIEKIVDRYVR